MKNLILLVASIGLLSPAVFADQVTLKNGDRLTGDIIKSDDKVLVLKSEFAGEVSIQWAAVDGICWDGNTLAVLDRHRQCCAPLTSPRS